MLSRADLYDNLWKRIFFARIMKEHAFFLEVALPQGMKI